MYDDEIGLESHSKKNLVGGDLDLIVASPTNGKPTVNILGQCHVSCNHVMHSIVVAESKRLTEPLFQNLVGEKHLHGNRHQTASTKAG